MDRKKSLLVMLVLYCVIGIAACIIYVTSNTSVSDTPVSAPQADYAAKTTEPASTETEAAVTESVTTETQATETAVAETAETESTETESTETESAETESATVPEDTETKAKDAETATEAEFTYTASQISNRQLCIRRGPSKDYKIIGHLQRGDTGDVISIEDEWVLLKSGDIEGYVFKDYLQITEKQ